MICESGLFAHHQSIITGEKRRVLYRACRCVTQHIPFPAALSMRIEPQFTMYECTGALEAIGSCMEVAGPYHVPCNFPCNHSMYISEPHERFHRVCYTCACMHVSKWGDKSKPPAQLLPGSSGTLIFVCMLPAAGRWLTCHICSTMFWYHAQLHAIGNAG
jgi:hypothetical protein